MVSAPAWTCTSRNRRPMMKARRNSGFTSSGRASVAMSKSLGLMPSRRSRTAPPTTKALNPASCRRPRDVERAARQLMAADGVVGRAVDPGLSVTVPSGQQAGEQAADHRTMRVARGNGRRGSPAVGDGRRQPRGERRSGRRAIIACASRPLPSAAVPWRDSPKSRIIKGLLHSLRGAFDFARPAGRRLFARRPFQENPCISTVKIPADGRKITVNKDSSLNVPDNPIIPVHRGRRHRPRYYAGDDRGRRCGGRQGLRRQAQDPLDGDLRRREIDQGLRSRRVAARRDARDRQGLRRVDQGPADHAGRRRHPLAQRRAAAGARPLRLPAPGAATSRGVPSPVKEPAEDRHGDLPRELRGHLRRHRMGGRVGRREEARSIS